MTAMHMSARRAFKRRSWWRVAAAARIRGRGRALPMHGYPPACLADLCVQLLAQLPENDFTAGEALGGAARTDTRSAATDTPCCIVREWGTLGGIFYSGIDRDGYLVVNQRLDVRNWPRTRGGKPLPLRLTRWLAGASNGMVVRHACDSPACIRLSHLVIGSQADNLADARRRRRRSLRSEAIESFGSPTPSAAVVGVSTRGGRAALAPPTSIGTSTGACSTSSPSKLARKRAREAAVASMVADGSARLLTLA